VRARSRRPRVVNRGGTPSKERCWRSRTKRHQHQSRTEIHKAGRNAENFATGGKLRDKRRLERPREKAMQGLGRNEKTDILRERYGYGHQGQQNSTVREKI